jgi:hypothetical protein
MGAEPDIHGRPTHRQLPKAEVHARPTIPMPSQELPPPKQVQRAHSVGLDASTPVHGASTIPVSAEDAVAAAADAAAAQAALDAPGSPDTIPHPLPAPKADDLRAEDISVPSKPVIKASKGKRAALLVAALLSMAAAAGGAWFVLQQQKPLPEQAPPPAATPEPKPKPPTETETPIETDTATESETATETESGDSSASGLESRDEPLRASSQTAKPKPTPRGRKPKPKPKPAPAVARSVEVKLQAPRYIAWQTTSGEKLGRGNGKANVPPDTSALVAVDGRRGVRSRVPVQGGSADYLALRTEQLVIVVRPWAKVWLGGEALGPTPLKPVDVVPGSYKLRFEHEGKTKEQTVVVKKGAGKTDVRVDMRD